MMKPERFLCLLLSCCFLHNSDCRSQLKQDCLHTHCDPCPVNHRAETVGNECCPHCIPLPGCLCPSHLAYDCPEDGYLLLGESAYIDYGTQKCTCISPNNIECASICPEIPPTCKYIGRPMDGCSVCACHVENDYFIEAGESIEKECEICKCPPEGGAFQCTKIC